MNDKLECRSLSGFPYSNNYDAMVNSDGKVWILGSAGIYIVTQDSLIQNEKYTYELLDGKRGLDGSLTANAWNYIDDKGNYYLSCNSGVYVVNIEQYNKNKTIYRIYDKETGMLRADLICFADETFNTEEDLLLFDPNATWKKTLLPGGTYTMRELLVPIFQHGECKYESPSVKEIAEFCRQEKETLWDETKRLFNPHKVYVDLSQKLYDTKTKLLNEAHH